MPDEVTTSGNSFSGYLYVKDTQAYDKFVRAEPGPYNEIPDIKISCEDIIAIAILKKQVPKKPTKQLIMDSAVWFCSICDDVVWSSAHLYGNRPNFCPHCGQRLDWSD